MFLLDASNAVQRNLMFVRSCRQRPSLDLNYNISVCVCVRASECARTKPEIDESKMWAKDEIANACLHTPNIFEYA